MLAGAQGSSMHASNRRASVAPGAAAATLHPPRHRHIHRHAPGPLLGPLIQHPGPSKGALAAGSRLPLQGRRGREGMRTDDGGAGNHPRGSHARGGSSSSGPLRLLPARSCLCLRARRTQAEALSAIHTTTTRVHTHTHTHTQSNTHHTLRASPASCAPPCRAPGPARTACAPSACSSPHPRDPAQPGAAAAWRRPRPPPPRQPRRTPPPARPLGGSR